MSVISKVLTPMTALFTMELCQWQLIKILALTGWVDREKFATIMLVKIIIFVANFRKLRDTGVMLITDRALMDGKTVKCLYAPCMIPEFIRDGFWTSFSIILSLIVPWRLRKAGRGVVWWRTRDPRATRYNRVTVIKWEHYLPPFKRY